MRNTCITAKYEHLKANWRVQTVVIETIRQKKSWTLLYKQWRGRTVPQISGSEKKFQARALWFFDQRLARPAETIVCVGMTVSQRTIISWPWQTKTSVKVKKKVIIALSDISKKVTRRIQTATKSIRECPRPNHSADKLQRLHVQRRSSCARDLRFGSNAARGVAKASVRLFPSACGRCTFIPPRETREIFLCCKWGAVSDPHMAMYLWSQAWHSFSKHRTICITHIASLQQRGLCTWSGFSWAASVPRYQCDCLWHPPDPVPMKCNVHVKVCARCQWFCMWNAICRI